MKTRIRPQLDKHCFLSSKNKWKHHSQLKVELLTLTLVLPFKHPKKTNGQHQPTKQLSTESHFNPNQITTLVHRVDCTCATQSAENGAGVEKLALPWRTFHRIFGIISLRFFLKIRATKLFSSVFNISYWIINSEDHSPKWDFFHFINILCSRLSKSTFL